MTAAADIESDAPARMDRRSVRNVAALFGAQAILSGQLLIHMTFGPLVGAMLAADPAWATAPISVMVVASALTAQPISLLMGRIGRRPGFMIGVLCGALGGGLGAYAIMVGSFPLFLGASLFLGVYQAHQNLFRFAATDTCSDALKPAAISWVLGGGLLAAFIGPAIGAGFKDALAPVPLAGAYAALIGLNLVGAIPLMLIDIPRPPRQREGGAQGRPLKEILADPVVRLALLCGMVTYSLMSLVMTAASTAVVGCGYGEAAASAVIGAHVFAMFAPSFFTGALIRRFGHGRVIGAGLALLAACGVVAATGIELERFFLALILLGLGWNFGFIGASSLLASAHRPEERGTIQGFNDFCVFGAVAVASLSSGALMHIFGWTAVNLAMAPLLSIAALALIWHATKMPEIRGAGTGRRKGGLSHQGLFGPRPISPVELVAFSVLNRPTLAKICCKMVSLRPLVGVVRVMRSTTWPSSMPKRLTSLTRPPSSKVTVTTV
ncbi:MAG: MFS transporter [Rhodobacteraceae bacterium]|nr:MFS transporter [Paracoccaceae bacterium]